MMLISTYQIKKRILNNWVAVVQSLSTTTNSQTSSADSSITALPSQWDVAASAKNELTLVNVFYSRNKDIHQQSVLQNLEVTAMILLAMLNVSSQSNDIFLSLVLIVILTGLHIGWIYILQKSLEPVSCNNHYINALSLT